MKTKDSSALQSNILDTIKLDKALRLAKNKSREGQLDEAKSIYEDILQKFSKNKKALSELQLLVKGERLVTQDPSSEQFQSIINLYSQGQLQRALSESNKMLERFPNSVALYNIAGAANAGLMQFESAINSYTQALKIKPDYAEAYNNMGAALQSKGDLESAINSYTQALKIKPDYAEVYYNMGIVLQGVVFDKPNSGLQEVINIILDQKNIVRPVDISKAAISLLKIESDMQESFKIHLAGEVKESLERLISNLSRAPLLFKLMSICPLPDLELEAIFMDMRAILLLSINEIKSSPKVLRFQSALALQCFTNEYIYSQSDKESSALVVLEAEVSEALSKGDQPKSQSILCLASYKALNQYKWSNLLNSHANIEEVFTRQIFEPNQENLLKSDIPALHNITNTVSSKVKKQYEENPYPRWVNVGLRLKPAPFFKATKGLELRLFDKTINDVQAPNILIAGCGTGQHSISTASRFENAKVLAVDLSMSSLAYAKRKTEELGIQNIDYMQADILELGKLNRKFNIIESSGVLHHMDEPIAGWRVLTDCLEPGGLMKIGLYSGLARQNILRMRKEINQSAIGSSDAAMKSFRSSVTNSSKEQYKKIQSSNDFYSMSELRDLLFHVQEHLFTIPQLKDCLSELGLRFCGFEANRIVRDFKLVNFGEDDLYNLDKWNIYEEANPHCFIGMYQFWCQKSL